MKVSGLLTLVFLLLLVWAMQAFGLAGLCIVVLALLIILM